MTTSDCGGILWNSPNPLAFSPQAFFLSPHDWTRALDSPLLCPAMSPSVRLLDTPSSDHPPPPQAKGFGPPCTQRITGAAASAKDRLVFPHLSTFSASASENRVLVPWCCTLHPSVFLSPQIQSARDPTEGVCLPLLRAA